MGKSFKPEEECRRQYAELTPLYRAALAAKNRTLAGNIRRKMDAVKSVAWSVGKLNARAKAKVAA